MDTCIQVWWKMNTSKDYFYLVCPKRIPNDQLVSVYERFQVREQYDSDKLVEKESKWLHQKEENIIDMVDRAFNICLPNKPTDPKPIRISSSTADAYGLDRLCANIQRNIGSLPYALWVLKIPTFVYGEDEYASSSKFTLGERSISKGFLLPVNRIAKIDGVVVEGIASNYVDRVYLNFPDCRRVINEKCMPLSTIYSGLVLSTKQEELASLSRNTDATNFDASNRLLLGSQYDFDACALHENNKDLPNGYLNKEKISEINETYLKDQLLDFRNNMSKFKIRTILEKDSIKADAEKRKIEILTERTM